MSRKAGWIVAVGVGGFIGTILRVIAVIMVDSYVSSTELWSIYAVNVAGSALIGIVAACVQTNLLTDRQRLFLAAGVLGSFTTFSLFSANNLVLLENGNFIEFLFFSVTQIGFGLLAVGLTYRLTLLVLGQETRRKS